MRKMQKAWFYNEYGSSNVLQFGDLPVPTVGPEEILVKVHAAALNPVDFKLRADAFSHDKFPVVIAGRPKTSVGTLAQYTVVEQHLVAHKPNNLSSEEAASLPVALLTAQKAFDMVNFERGQSVFVVGGAGGIGSVAIQLAKHINGASRIVSNVSTGKLDFVKSLGADLVVDYTKQSYDQVPEKFDFVFDTIGDLFKSYVLAKEEAPIIDIAQLEPHPRAKFFFLASLGSHLDRFREYLESGKVKAVINPKSPYSFSEVLEAFKHLESGWARGNIFTTPIE
ncbi:hypothetical protein KI387_000549 [Taxus chinensis]|uniref:Enoyl reductase (ER) domain-containing protein n=1 Tax=Taxus chinensis TaxID=29808 RepID=A0AA38GSR3_TAXCH|nr:hypothetical protein KI387_000549 [Taxus chinensis]